MKATLLSVMGDDLMVVNAARVSFKKYSALVSVFSCGCEIPEENNDRHCREHVDGRDEWQDRLSQVDAKLIQYLARNNHWTPFGHPQLQFHIKAPLFVRSQWYRSVVGNVRNEVSRRYVDDAPEFFRVEVWRKRPEGGIKQGSGGELEDVRQALAKAAYNRALEACDTAYSELLAYDVAPEQARMVLPQSMYTEWWETGSLYYWARICKLRLHPHAQAETRELARQVAEQVVGKFPVSWKALMGGAFDEPK